MAEVIFTIDKAMRFNPISNHSYQLIILDKESIDVKLNIIVNFLWTTCAPMGLERSLNVIDVVKSSSSEA